MKKLFSIFLVLVLFFALPVAVSAAQKTLIVVSQPDPLMDSQWVYGPLYLYTPMDDAAWDDAKPTVLIYDSRWGIPIPTATWISTASSVENNQVDSWRWFHAKMNIACTAYNITGSVEVTSDNAEEFYFNGFYIGTDGEVQLPYYDNGEWGTVITYPIIPQAGANTLDFIVRNYPPWYPDASGTYLQNEPNPTGLIFKATVSYELPDVVWQPPITNDAFALKDGTTLPIKFKLQMQDETLITDINDVKLMVHEGAYSEPLGQMVKDWYIGDGGDFLRFDIYEYYYVANFHTKKYGLIDGGVYTAVVYDVCTGDVLGHFDFIVSTSSNTSRGKK